MNPLMRFEEPNCPECGVRAIGTVEIIKAVALVRFTSADTASYTAETTSGEQYSLGRGPNQLELTCGAHEWPSYLLPVEDTPDPDPLAGVPTARR